MRMPITVELNSYSKPEELFLFCHYITDLLVCVWVKENYYTQQQVWSLAKAQTILRGMMEVNYYAL